MSVINKFGAVLRKLTGVVSIFSYVGYFAIVGITVVDVFLRYVLNSPIKGSYEMIQYIMLVVVFASFAYCQSLHGHVHVTMLLLKMPQRLKFVCYTVTGILSLITVVYLAIAAAQQAQYYAAKNFTSSVLGFQTFPFLWLECICLGIFVLVIVYDILCSAIAIFNKQMADEIERDWM